MYHELDAYTIESNAKNVRSYPRVVIQVYQPDNKNLP